MLLGIPGNIKNKQQCFVCEPGDVEILSKNYNLTYDYFVLPTLTMSLRMNVILF